MATANWPWPPDCFLCRPSASAGLRDRLPVADLHVLGGEVDAELPLEALEGDGQVRLAGAPEDGLVGLLVAVDDEGRILILEAVQRAGQLVVVGLRLRPRPRWRAPAPAARSGRRGPAAPWGRACRRWRCPTAWRRRRCRRRRAASTGSCSLPRTMNRPWRRSSVPVRLFTRWSSLRIVPESTLSRETWPTNGSAIVLNTTASGCPSGSAGTSTSVSPARTVVGRSAGGGPISTSRSASRSMPTSAVAEPHTTGNTLAVSMPRVRACSSSSRPGTSPSRYRSSRSSSATTMPSTRLSCTWCSRASISSGIGSVCGTPPS